MFNSNDWDVLIPRIELNLLNPDSGCQYWLDIQRYVVQGLESKGGIFIKAGEEINKLQELAELAKEIEKIIKNQKFKKRVMKSPETISAQREKLKAEIKGLDETYKVKQDLFFKGIQELYKLEKKYNGFHNKIRDLNKDLKVLEKAGSKDDKEKIKIFQKSFPEK